MISPELLTQTRHQTGPLTDESQDALAFLFDHRDTYPGALDADGEPLSDEALRAVFEYIHSEYDGDLLLMPDDWLISEWRAAIDTRSVGRIARLAYQRSNKSQWDTARGHLLCALALGSAREAIVLGFATSDAKKKHVPSRDFRGFGGPRLEKVACAWWGLIAQGTPTALFVLGTWIKRQDKPTAWARYLEECTGRVLDEVMEECIPDVGFDERGRRFFDLGSRVLEVAFQEDGELALKDDAGKIYKRMPRGRSGDDAELMAEAKAEFEVIAKVVPIVVTQQRCSFTDAMLAQRGWSFDEWSAHFREHPLVWSLAQSFVWALEREGEDPEYVIHTQEDEFVGLDYETREPSPGDTLRLMHPALLERETLQQLASMLGEFEIIQPIRQVSQVLIDDEDAVREDVALVTANMHVIWHGVAWAKVARRWDLFERVVLRRKLPGTKHTAALVKYLGFHDALTPDDLPALIFYRTNNRAPLPDEDVPPQVLNDVRAEVRAMADYLRDEGYA